MSEMMRRVRVVAPDQYAIESVLRPSPAAGQVQVRTALTGVCGSDTHAAAGRHPFVPLPYAPGHEVVGVVTDVAPDVTGVVPGDRVTVEPTLPCGHCKTCRTDRSNLCENLQFFGCGHDQGGMADYFTIGSDRVYPVPDHIDDRTAALIEPLATPVHAVRIAGDVSGKAVAIIGAGTIGLFVLKAARYAGARRIVMIDPLPAKRELALRLGADVALDSDTADLAVQARAELGESADVVFDCVAIQPTLDQAVSMAMKAGTVVIVGVPEAQVTIPLPHIQDQQIRLQGSATYMREDYDTAVAMISDEVVRAEDFITATFAMEQVADAFAASSSGEHVKVLITT